MDYQSEKPITYIISKNKDNSQNIPNYHNVLEVKKTLLLLKIQISRKLAMEKIANKIIEAWNKRKTIIINKIINRRNKCAGIIQSHWKSLRIRTIVKSIKEKNKHSFCLTSNIKTVYKLDLKVYSSNTTKFLNFNYCEVRDSYVLYVPKTMVRNTVLRVNFIADDKVFIDPTYRTDYDSNGNFYNIIDFKLFDEFEKERNYELNQLRIDFTRKLNCSDEEFSKSKINRNYTMNFMRDSIPKLNHNYMKSVINLPNLKPCLKTSDSNSNLNSGRKRVSFSNVD
jgi:hypothetical protein